MKAEPMKEAGAVWRSDRGAIDGGSAQTFFHFASTGRPEKQFCFQCNSALLVGTGPAALSSPLTAPALLYRRNIRSKGPGRSGALSIRSLRSHTEW